MQQSTRYCGVLPCWLCAWSWPSLYVTRSATLSQCKSAVSRFSGINTRWWHPVTCSSLPLKEDYRHCQRRLSQQQTGVAGFCLLPPLDICLDSVGEGVWKKSWFLTSSSAVAERPRCRVHCDSYGQKWKTGTGRQYFTDIIGYYRSTFNHCDVIGQSSYWVRWKSKISAITPFKVIQGHQGWYQSKALMRLPIND